MGGREEKFEIRLKLARLTLKMPIIAELAKNSIKILPYGQLRPSTASSGTATL